MINSLKKDNANYNIELFFSMSSSTITLVCTPHDISSVLYVPFSSEEKVREFPT